MSDSEAQGISAFRAPRSAAREACGWLHAGFLAGGVVGGADTGWAIARGVGGLIVS